MKKTFALLLCFTLLVTFFPAPSLPVSAADTPASAFGFNAKTGTIAGLTDKGKPLTELVIPAEINGIAVTTIGYYAFHGCTSLTNVTIPDSATTVGIDAFSDCTFLTSVTIPNSVTTIGGRAFCGCRSLTSVTIPDSVTTVGIDAFSGCTALEKIYIPKGCQTPVKKVLDGCIELSDIYYGGTQAQWYNISEGFNPYIEIHLNSSEKSFRRKYDKSANNVGAVVAIVVSVLVLAAVVAAVVVKKRKARRQASSEGVVPSQDAPDSHTAADAQDGVATQLCPNCGYRLSGGFVYCPKCGKKL